MKAVFTRKAGTARKKVRAVLCGNQEPVKHETALEKRIATFAGGVDLGLLRLLLAEAVVQGYTIVSWDVATAFLNAPARPRNLKDDNQRQIIIGIPPKVLVRQGVIKPNTLYEVLLAVYRRDTSSLDWGLRRTETLEKLRVFTSEGEVQLKKSIVDPSIWYLVRSQDGQYLGWLAIYIVADRAYEAVNAVWECGGLERVTEGQNGAPLRFDGLELSWMPGKQALFVGQPSYIQNLLGRQEKFREQAVPLVKPLLDDEPSEPEDREALRQCQQVLGELLYLAVRTRPETMYACSRLASVMSHRPKEVLQLTQGVLGYLSTTADLGLVYRKSAVGNDQPEIRAFSDAGYAPESSRSQECALVFWFNSCVHWLSAKQPFVVQSTCEAELITIVTAANLAQSFQELARELRYGQVPKCLALNDNASAVLLASSDVSNWRTRHLPIRANVLKERVAKREWDVCHVPGETNTADIGTKVLGADRFAKLRGLIGMGSLEKHTKAAKAQVHRAATALYALVLSSCVGTSEAASEEEGTGDWVLGMLLIVWSIAVIAVWKWVRSCGSRRRIPVREPEPDPWAAPEPQGRGGGAEIAEEEPFGELEGSEDEGPVREPSPPPETIRPPEPVELPEAVRPL